MDIKKNNTIIAKSIAVLFGCYGRSDDIHRQALYVKKLQYLPAQLIVDTCNILMLTSKYLPALYDIILTCKVINPNQVNKAKPWPEALREIREQTYRCGLYQKPTFSCKEISDTIDTFGWMRWCNTPDSQIMLAQSQLQNIYEHICNTCVILNTHKYLLEKKPDGLLGYTEHISDNMTSISKIVADLKEQDDE